MITKGPSLLAPSGVRLTPFEPAWTEVLRAWRNDTTSLYLWNGSRDMVDPEGFSDELKELRKRAIFTALIWLGTRERPCGFLYVDGASRSRTSCTLALFVDESVRLHGVAPAAVALCLRYVFFAFDVAKVKFTISGWNAASLSTFEHAARRGFCRKEGVETAEVRLAGELWDLHLFAIHREDFSKFLGSPIGRRLLGDPDGHLTS